MRITLAPLVLMASRPRILIVEDNADLRRLYAIGLNQHGFEVKLAANGAEALERVQEEKPDLILLDLIMPLMSGWEVLDKINPADQPTRIPVIVVTGQTTPPERRSHPSIIGWLFKPAMIEELVDLIHRKMPGGSPRSSIFPNGNAGPDRLSSASG